MSHRIAIMSGGRIMQIGNALEIYERPNNKFVADFIGETNLLGGKCMSPDRVSCESFELAVAAGDELVGKSVLVSIRPEKITAGKKLVQPLENKFEGLVEENFFKGSFMVYKIRVAENTRLTINVPNVDADSRFQPGEQVLVGWDRDASVVVRE
jgi:ABC-type Fe3+/spermidine/putrescine transport system ATPase subunit